jgi:ribosome hibernation promoting factor
MHVRLNADDADASNAIRGYVERRLRLVLSRFGARVGHITVRIRADGPSANHCKIVAELVPFGQVVVDQADHDLFIAIDRATGKMGRQFDRQLERIRNSRVGRESVRMAA